MKYKPLALTIDTEVSPRVSTFPSLTDICTIRSVDSAGASP